jgi:hypothetical protein
MTDAVSRAKGSKEDLVAGAWHQSPPGTREAGDNGRGGAERKQGESINACMTSGMRSLRKRPPSTLHSYVSRKMCTLLTQSIYEQ